MVRKKTESLYNKYDYRSKNYSGKYAKEKHEHLPKKVYKFFPFTLNSLNCLENQTVYLNTPENFNDPFDCHIVGNELKFIKKYIIHKKRENCYPKKGS